MKRIFVSSTFIDMNNERDAIGQIVAPAVNELAKDYGESIGFCDLRWGIDTSNLESEEGSRKVLSVCLDEIDNCAPYMIVLLGQRYGWIPSQELIHQTLDTKPGFTLDELEKSVTALEIEYGALRNPEQLKHTLFYFREITGPSPAYFHAEDPLHAQKADALKARIQKLAGSNLRYYSLHWDEATASIQGIEDFSAMLIEDIHALMEEEWKEYASLSPYEKDQRWQMNLMQQNVRPYPDQLSWVDAYLEENTPFFRIHGSAATGRTSLVCSMAAHLQEKGWNILPIFSCKTESCNSVQDVQKYIAYHLWNLLPSTEKELFQEISFADSNTSAIDKASSQRDSLTLWQDRITELSLAYERSVDANLLIFIDDADLLQRGSGEDLLRLLPANLGRKIRMVVTVLDAKTIPYGEKRGADTEHDPRNIIDYTLQSLHRELGEDVINAILAKPQSAHAMYTNLLVHRLCMFDSKDYAQINANGGGIEAISNYQKSIINQCGNDFDLAAELLQKAAQQLDNPSLYVAMEYLAASKNGLKEEDLASLLEQQGMHWVSLDFRRFLLYLSPFFITRNDGRIFFSSRFLLQGVVSSSLDHLGYHPILLEYLKAHPSDEKAYISEIAYQCIRGKDPVSFLEYLIQHQENANHLYTFAQELGIASINDYGKFLHMLFDQAEISSYTEILVQFVVSYWRTMFSSSPQARMIYGYQRLPRVVSFAQELWKEENSPKRLKNLIDIQLLTGDILFENMDSALCKQALEHYKDAITNAKLYCQQATNLEETYDRLYLYYTTLYHLAYYYYHNKVQKEYSLALDLYKECEQIWQQLLQLKPDSINNPDYAYLYVAIGDIHRASKEYSLALENYTKALHLYDEIIEEATQKGDSTTALADAQSIVFERLFLIYMRLKKLSSNPFAFDSYDKTNSEEYDNKAWEYLNRLMAFTIAQLQRFPTLYWRDSMSIVYHHFGTYYESLMGQENLEKAAENYEESALIQDQLLEDGFFSPEILNKAAYTYTSAGKVRELLHGIDNANKALKNYRTAIKRYNTCSSQFGLPGIGEKLIPIYRSIGHIFSFFGGTSNYTSALKEYKEALHDAFVVYRHKQDISSRQMVIRCLEDLVSTYRMLDNYDLPKIIDDVFTNDLSYRNQNYGELVTELENLWNGKTINPFDF